MATTKIPEKCQKTQSQTLDEVKGLSLRHLILVREACMDPTNHCHCLYVRNVHTVRVLKSSLSHFKYGVGSTCLSHGYCCLDDSKYMIYTEGKMVFIQRGRWSLYRWEGGPYTEGKVVHIQRGRWFLYIGEVFLIHRGRWSLYSGEGGSYTEGKVVHIQRGRWSLYRGEGGPYTEGKVIVI